MRTPEEIKREFEQNGFVDLSVEETAAISVVNDNERQSESNTLFVTYSETTTVGRRSVTKTASVSVPMSYGDHQSVLSALNKCVRDATP